MNTPSRPADLPPRERLPAARPASRGAASRKIRSALRPALLGLSLSGLSLGSSGLGGSSSGSPTPSGQLVTIGDLHSENNLQVWYMSIPVIIMAVLIFVGVSWALFHTVQRFREDRNDAPPQQFHGNNRLETLLVAVPVVIVSIIAILTVRTMAIVNPTPPNALKINVTGQQFWWAFDYPGTSAQGGGTVVNGNELVIPAGRSVALTATAKDVIHAFWAPNLGGQRDAIPGSKKTWQVDTKRPGVYQGNCSVLCGASHANMRFKVIALPPAQYNSFIRGAQAYKAPAPQTASTKNGYAIFMQGKASAAAAPCMSCHRIQGTPANGAIGPDLSYFGSRNTLGAGRWEGQEARAMIEPWIRNPAAVKPGALMPAYEKLSQKDLADLKAYLLTLKLPPQAEYWGKVPVR